jgi:membrane associated rhomboid family serine protease
MLTLAMHMALTEPPPPVRPAIAVAAALLIVLPASILAGVLIADGRAVPVAVILPLALFVFPVVLGLRALWRAPRVGALAIDHGAVAVRLPGHEPFEAPLMALRVLRAAKVGLVVGTEERAMVIPRACLALPAADVVQAIHQALALHPEGAALSSFLWQRDQAAHAGERRPLAATYAVAAIIALVFALEILAGALTDGRVLLVLGAARRDLVFGGGGLELWRIPAAALMHGHVLHLVLNATTLLVLGPVLERWLSTWRYVLVLLGAALIGTGASAMLRTDVATVGLSGGLFGLLGALATTTVRYRTAPLLGPRLPARSWVILLVTNAAITLAPGVDAWAHVGGAIAGALIALPLTPSVRSGDGAPERVPSIVQEQPARVVAIMVIATYLFGLGGLVHAFVTR